MNNDEILGIVLIVAVALVLLVIRRLISAGVNKGVNAASNAIKRAQEEKNPPKPQNLAERYGSTSSQGKEGE